MDRNYAEKADGRLGGVGTETQIITPKIYEKADQNKFVGVASEVDADGKPFRPTYYSSRIYIDLSNDDIYPQNFDQLLRWIFDKPAYPKPVVGKPPEFLKEEHVLLPTRSHAARAISLLRSGSSLADSALKEYFDSLSENMEALRIVPADGINFDDQLLTSIGAFLPYRDEFIGLMTMIAKVPPSEHYIVALVRFFEHMIPYMFRLETMSSWSEHWFDNYKFITYELFLYTIAILIKQERFSDVDAFLAGGFYSPAGPLPANDPMNNFSIFSNHLQSLESRKSRLKLNRISPTGRPNQRPIVPNGYFPRRSDAGRPGPVHSQWCRDVEKRTPWKMVARNAGLGRTASWAV
jgi:hypothetical protein